MSATYKLDKHCPVCGKLLADKNKTGYCSIHRDRTGANNPFYGKTFSKETLDKIKEHCIESSKKLWENEEYRNKVISNIIGLKRSDEFKEKQRQAAYKQFEDDYQREIRSIRMKQSWDDGEIIYVPQKSYNKSKEERDFISKLNEKLNNEIRLNEVFHYTLNDKEHWLFPDGVIGNVVIEYNGSYWHADERFYQDDFIIDGKLAKDIRERDKSKKKIYEDLGYIVIYAWSYDYKKKKENYIEEIATYIKNINNDRDKEK